MKVETIPAVNPFRRQSFAPSWVNWVPLFCRLCCPSYSSLPKAKIFFPYQTWASCFCFPRTLPLSPDPFRYFYCPSLISIVPPFFFRLSITQKISLSKRCLLFPYLMRRVFCPFFGPRKNPFFGLFSTLLFTGGQPLSHNVSVTHTVAPLPPCVSFFFL